MDLEAGWIEDGVKLGPSTGVLGAGGGGWECEGSGVQGFAEAAGYVVHVGGTDDGMDGI